VRVPDLPALIRRIAPALERRLAGSPASGYTGELRLDFYRGGLRLAFEGGCIGAAENWSPRAERWGPRAQAGFPPLVFLQLLFAAAAWPSCAMACRTCGPTARSRACCWSRCSRPGRRG
jgi:hypothetical protein